jgi:hypothetical protein
MSIFKKKKKVDIFENDVPYTCSKCGCKEFTTITNAFQSGNSWKFYKNDVRLKCSSCGLIAPVDNKYLNWREEYK